MGTVGPDCAVQAADAARAGAAAASVTAMERAATAKPWRGVEWGRSGVMAWGRGRGVLDEDSRSSRDVGETLHSPPGGRAICRGPASDPFHFTPPAAMLTILNARQIKLLSETAAGAPEPATAQALRQLAELRQLGLLSFDEGGRYELTPQGQARIQQYAPAVH